MDELFVAPDEEKTACIAEIMVLMCTRSQS
jgi:hypothetical protein